MMEVRDSLLKKKLAVFAGTFFVVVGEVTYS